MARRIFFPSYVPSFKANGVVNNGGTIAFKAAGTSNDKATFANYSLSTTNSNPIALNGQGRATIFLAEDGLYDITELDSSGSTINTISSYGNDLSAVLTDLNENKVSNHSFETAGTGGEPFANWTQSGSTVTRSTSQNTDGAASCQIQCSGGAGSVTCDKFEIDEELNLYVAFTMFSSAASEPSGNIIYYNAAQSSFSSVAFYNDNAGITPAAWTRRTFIRTPPGTARYAAVQLVGNATGALLNTFFDNVRAWQEEKLIATHLPQGLTLSNDTDTAHDVNITAGATKDFTLTQDIVLPTEITKQIDAPWAAGDDAGGMDTGGVAADTAYAVYLIKSSTTGAVDACFSTNWSSPTFPTGYNLRRLVGWVMTDASSNILAFTHVDNYFRLNNTYEAVSDTTITSNTFETYTLPVPPNCLVTAYFFLYIPNSTDDQATIWVKRGGSDETAGTADSDVDAGFLSLDYASASADYLGKQGTVMVDSSRQIEIAGLWEGTLTGEYIRVNITAITMLTRNAPS